MFSSSESDLVLNINILYHCPSNEGMHNITSLCSPRVERVDGIAAYHSLNCAKRFTSQPRAGLKLNGWMALQLIAKQMTSQPSAVPVLKG